MSRTIRRKKKRRGSKAWDSIDWYVSEWVLAEHGYYIAHRRPYPKDSKEYKKGYARYHSDAGSHSCKEPGPGWFRNLYSQRPYRRKARNEIRKFIFDPNYEPMILSKDKLPYWT